MLSGFTQIIWFTRHLFMHGLGHKRLRLIRLSAHDFYTRDVEVTE